ncbi:MAG TPA: lipoate--protein ligase family protein, partial [Verrucomicrobiae bacterium]|nr:lipoate--protein ligase family protein [Verrucomicrobiae bacterium]
MLETWLLLNSGPGAADFNMAFDEALLEASAQRGKPVLRFYGWKERAASFGYFQKYEEIARLTLLRPLVRRPTGGGLVPHDADWTYSLVFPPDHGWHALRATESYRRVHECIRAAFAKLNVPAELSPGRRKELPGQCFAGAEQFDLLWNGKKIAGAAQRRNRHGLLIQGSVQPPPIKVAKADWQKAMCDAACERWKARWFPLEIETPLNQRVQ